MQVEYFSLLAQIGCSKNVTYNEHYKMTILWIEKQDNNPDFV